LRKSQLLDQSTGGSEVNGIDWRRYVGAHHGFDVPQLQPGISVLGHWLEYDKHAATDAREKLSTLLATNLGTAP
jgi:dienelactone hydrolase